MTIVQNFSMDHYNAGDKLGGKHCELYCRKENVCSSLQENPFTGKPCIRIELSRNSTSEISKELDLSDEVLAGLIEEHKIHCTRGDRLCADAITVYVDQRRPIKFDKDEGATHTHGGRFASTSNNTFSEIKYMHEHIRNGEIKRIQSQKQIKDKNEN